PVVRLSAPELARFGVPSLEDVLALDIPVNLELKEEAAIPAVVELIHGRADVVVSSFDPDALDFLHQLQPALPLGYLAREEDCSDVLARAVAAHAFAFEPPCSAVTDGLVAEAHAAGLRVMPYTVSGQAEARRLFAMAVDAV